MEATLAAEASRSLRCAIYTRKSTEHGLEQEFNSLDAQREACEAYIKSQSFQGWKALPQQYNDPAYPGGNLDRPAPEEAAGRYRSRQSRCRRGLQDRPPNPLPRGFRKAGRDL